MRRVTLLAVLVATVAACTSGTGSASAKPLVLATTTIFADMARNVGGDRVTVESIVPAGSHVEEYEPKPEDSKKDASVITLTDGLPAIDHDNPHMWFDVQRARKYVEKMRDALIALDGAGKQYYTDRAKAYDDELVKLDGEVRSQIAAIPPARRKLVTSHDAFPYFAQAYGLDVLGFAQIEPGKDPTPGELADLVRKVKAAGVPAIFSEVGVSDAVAQTLAKEADVTKVVTDLPTDS